VSLPTNHIDYSYAFEKVPTMVFLLLYLLPSCFHLCAFRSGRLTYDEKADIDIRYIDNDFSDCLEEDPLDDDALSQELVFTDEEPKSSEGGASMGAGLLSGAAAVGFQSLSNRMGRAWDNADDNAPMQRLESAA
jgi:hypothetical protein